MAKALLLISATATDNAPIAPKAPPEAVGAPRKGKLWISMMMTPIPDMNPETTT